MVMMALVLMLKLRKLRRQRGAVLHGLDKLGAGQLIPGRGDDHGVAVELLEKRRGGGSFALAHIARAAEDDNVRVFNLIVEKLAEVADIHFAFSGVHHSDLGADLGLVRHGGNGPGNVGKLADAGGLNDDAVGGIGFDDLLQSRFEIAHEGAADAAGIHLGYFNAGVLQEAAVYGDLAEFVFYQHYLLPGVRLFYQLADERCFAGAQKAGKNINFCHIKMPPVNLYTFLT